MFGSPGGRIRRALDAEINRARRFSYHVGVLILDVSDTTPRGVHDHLPGLTVNVKRVRNLLREYDVVIKTQLRRYTVILPHLDQSESAHVVKDRLLQTAQEQNWGPINVSVAIFPEHGLNSRDLMRRAEKDLKSSVVLELDLV
jgi:GGDEF domain-containing protein